jgi:uncharacterized iron-regulated protein
MSAATRAVACLGLSLFAGIAARASLGYVPQRVFDSARGQFGDFETMLADVARADVVFVGEQHDDPNTHRLELAVLEGLRRRRSDITVALEMFERDVQEPLDHFQMGHIAEGEFLKDARPWPRYATDYKPLVDFAIAHEWPVVAGNVPRSLASDVSKSGLSVLAAKSDAEKKWFAADLQCPLDDDYFKRFGEAMGDHSGVDASAGEAAKRQSLERFYFAQCLKDETMGESVAQAWRIGSLGGKRPLVVHFNGSFHSDFAEGTAARAKRRLPAQRIVVISVMPVADLDAMPPPDSAERKRADYLVYTVK